MGLFSKISVKKKILTIVLTGATFLVLIIGFSFFTIERLNSSSRELVDISKAIQNVIAIEKYRDEINYETLLAFNIEGGDKEGFQKYRDKQLDLVKDYKNQLSELKDYFGNDSTSNIIDTITQLNQFAVAAEKLPQLLLDDDMMGFMENASKFRSIFDESIGALAVIHERLETREKEINANNNQLTETTNILLLSSGAVALLLSLTFSFAISKVLVDSVNKIRAAISRLSTGELEEIKNIKGKDDMAEIMVDINSFIDNLKNTSQFAEEIGKGNFELNYQPLSDKDTLGISLVKMKENLLESAKGEEERNWAVAGLAKFGELLRNSSQSIEDLSVKLISEIVTYLKANQGGIFVLTEDDDEKYLELTGSYAYERVKFAQKRLQIGEGLVGQCFLENEKIFLTDVPEAYINITSGLGEAPPRCVALFPIKINEETFGVLEIASFSILPEHHVAFLEKLCESIASALKNVESNSKTSKLLAESNEMMEQLHQQEEEMRQNMEEMQATSEEMDRMTRRKDEEIKELRKELGELKQQMSGGENN